MQSKKDVLDFCGFTFSRAELRSAIVNIPESDPKDLRAKTDFVERLGASMGSDSSDASIREFSELVCRWGKDMRVWGNLKKEPSLEAKLRAWFADVRKPAITDEVAIRAGDNIKGLGVSFASKHLRMLDPERFAVLDSVLSAGLGFAPNPKGYALFMRCLREFKQRIAFNGTVATLEYGLFTLARPIVRRLGAG